MTDTITLPRSVVEQALEAMDDMASDSRLLSMVPSRVQGFDAARDALRAALEQLQDHVEQHLKMVPFGWKLVPEKPTPKMVDAACQDGISLDGRPVWKHTVDVQAEWRWKKMLAAAPQPTAVEQEPVAEVIVSHTRAGLNGPYTAEVASRERLSVGAELFIHPQPPVVGEVVVTTNQKDACVAVTRQDAEGQILSVIWEAKQPPVAEQKPLTDEQIETIWDDWYRSWTGLDQFEAIVCMVEKHHGIGGEK